MRTIARDGLYVSSIMHNDTEPLPEPLASVSTNAFKQVLRKYMHDLLRLGYHLWVVEKCDILTQGTSTRTCRVSAPTVEHECVNPYNGELSMNL